MIANSVKLVIWDLDDTFWRGVLSEEVVTPIDANIYLVKELAARGIPSSICSKNDPERAAAKLRELGVHDYFVFPRIRFAPKGAAVAEIIEAANLRPQNVLFLDDNAGNLEEVCFFNPGIMATNPSDLDLPHGLLDHPRLKGRSDPELRRLRQYRLMEHKAEKRQAANLSNEEFLRSCHIRLQLDFDVMSHLDRIIELINRANQLNFTKLRVETPEDLSEFRQALEMYGCHAAAVSATDDYGDYGIVGFYLHRRRAGINRLQHFVFSCRIMHMGIEQYVYEMLGRPDIAVAAPTAYGLQEHDAIDWIELQDGVGSVPTRSRAGSLLLLGGCDLLQLASYCSSNRVEFVNKIENGFKVRYDDPGFVLSDRTATANCPDLRAAPTWTHEDTIAFDRAVESSEVLLVSLWPAMTGDYFRTAAGVLLHFSQAQIKKLRRLRFEWLSALAPVTLSEEDRVHLIRQSFGAMGERSGEHAAIFALGCYTQGEFEDEQRDRRRQFNDVCRSWCEARAGKFHFVDFDSILSARHLIDRAHLTHEGYHLLARCILSRIAGVESAPALDAA